jgi:hypothetical protein
MTKQEKSIKDWLNKPVSKKLKVKDLINIRAIDKAAGTNQVFAHFVYNNGKLQSRRLQGKNLEKILPIIKKLGYNETK